MEDVELNINAPDPNAYPSAELHYYYSREKRLKNAQGRISRRYEPPSRKSGFFRSLTDTAPKLMLFITIAVLCVIIVVLRYAMR
jgi:hypothetical protein